MGIYKRLLRGDYNTTLNYLNAMTYNGTQPVPEIVYDVYSENVVEINPLVYWPLNETAYAPTADNAMGDSSYDGANTNSTGRVIFHRTFGYHFSSSLTNIYSSALNSNMNKDEGTISMWFKVRNTADWTATAFQRFLSIAVSDNDQFLIQLADTSILTVYRIRGGVSKQVSHDFSATKPLTWQHVAFTYSVSNDQLKLFINGVQSGSTQTGILTMAGTINSTRACIGAVSTSIDVPAIETSISNVAIFNSVVTSDQLTVLSTIPSGSLTSYLTHSIQASWNINSLFGVTGGSLACFMYDVDNDGELEFVGNIGRRARFVAVKQNQTILWDTTVDATQRETGRFPRIHNGFLYYCDSDKLYCIRLSDGAHQWTKTVLPSVPTYITCNITNQGIVVAGGTTLDIRDFTTGNSIGGSFPLTLPWTVWEQSLSTGDLDMDGQDEIFVNDNAGNFRAIDHDGSTMFDVSSSHSHNDLYEVYDVNEDGFNELVCVVDDNNSSTQVAGEGDELVIYDASGNQIDKYTASSVGGIQFHCVNFPNGGKVAFSLENDTVGRTITLLDKNLTAVWSKDAGVPYEGDQFNIYDIDGDGIPEMLFSNEVYSTTSGFRVIDYTGTPKLFFSADNPKVLYDLMDGKGGVASIQWLSTPQGIPYSIPYLCLFISRTDSDIVNEMIYLHKWQQSAIL